MGRLTTHVLDTARGCPASGLVINLFRVDGGTGNQPALIVSTKTNDDGRCDAPLLDGDAMQKEVSVTVQSG